MTGFAQDLLNPTSCTASRVQRRWTACTLICIRASVASTDKTVPTVAIIISLPWSSKLQHQPTTSNQSPALETACTATCIFYVLTKFLATCLIPPSTKSAKPRQSAGTNPQYRSEGLIASSAELGQESLGIGRHRSTGILLL